MKSEIYLIAPMAMLWHATNDYDDDDDDDDGWHPINSNLEIALRKWKHLAVS